MVSTHTINLQEQPRDRDIPLLTQVVPFPFKAAIFKGRGHYLCLRKFEHKINRRDFHTPKEDVITAAQMLVWLTQTENGDDEELNLGGRGGISGRPFPVIRILAWAVPAHGSANVIITGPNMKRASRMLSLRTIRSCSPT